MPTGTDGSGTGGAPRGTGKSEPTLVAHRGCAAEYPENTLAAIESVAGRVDAIEVDVRRCATGELVAFHDETLDRVTDATGAVAETPLGTLRSVTVGGSDDAVPSLRAVLEAVPGSLEVVLDLKERGAASEAVALAASVENDVIVSARDPAVLRAAREADPSVRTALVVSESLPNLALRPVVPALPDWLYAPEDVASVVSSALELGCEAVHPRLELCLRTDLVERAHAAGLRVRPWTITGRGQFEALRGLGVDGVITDVSAELTG